jgi:8-oxo-dGTP pyrophosphatase MutT (NUDIX family)
MEEKMVVTFDFDNTIAMSHITFISDEPEFIFESYNDVIISKIMKHIHNGDEVYIVTARDKAKEDLFPTDNIPYHLKKIGLDGYFLPDRVFYTNDQPKLKLLRKLESEMHWDDNMEEIIALKKAKMKVKHPYDLLDDSLMVAKALIFDKNDRILVLERSDDGNLWDIPGGHLKKVEENRGWLGKKEGLFREVTEETGLFLPNEKFVGTYNLFWKEEVHEITLFACKFTSETPEINLNLQDFRENLSYEWVTYDELLKMLPKSVKTLKKAIEFFPKDKMISLEEATKRSWAENHQRMKAKLIGMGGNEHFGGGKGHKRANMARSKSAPAGFGVLEEENEEKPLRIKVKITPKRPKITYIGHHTEGGWDEKWHDLKPKDDGDK